MSSWGKVDQGKLIWKKLPLSQELSKPKPEKQFRELSGHLYVITFQQICQALFFFQIWAGAGAAEHVCRSSHQWSRGGAFSQQLSKVIRLYSFFVSPYNVKISFPAFDVRYSSAAVLAISTIKHYFVRGCKITRATKQARKLVANIVYFHLQPCYY